MTKEQMIEHAWQKQTAAQRKLLTSGNAAKRAQLATVVAYWANVRTQLTK